MSLSMIAALLDDKSYADLENIIAAENAKEVVPEEPLPLPEISDFKEGDFVRDVLSGNEGTVAKQPDGDYGDGIFVKFDKTNETQMVRSDQLEKVGESPVPDSLKNVIDVPEDSPIPEEELQDTAEEPPSVEDVEPEPKVEASVVNIHNFVIEGVHYSWVEGKSTAKICKKNPRHIPVKGTTVKDVMDSVSSFTTKSVKPEISAEESDEKLETKEKVYTDPKLPGVSIVWTGGATFSVMLDDEEVAVMTRYSSENPGKPPSESEAEEVSKKHFSYMAEKDMDLYAKLRDSKIKGFSKITDMLGGLDKPTARDLWGFVGSGYAQWDELLTALADHGTDLRASTDSLESKTSDLVRSGYKDHEIMSMLEPQGYLTSDIKKHLVLAQKPTSPKPSEDPGSGMTWAWDQDTQGWYPVPANL